MQLREEFNSIEGQIYTIGSWFHCCERKTIADESKKKNTERQV
jgi:hypothetical protein